MYCHMPFPNQILLLQWIFVRDRCASVCCISECVDCRCYEVIVYRHSSATQPALLVEKLSLSLLLPFIVFAKPLTLESMNVCCVWKRTNQERERTNSFAPLYIYVICLFIAIAGVVEWVSELFYSVWIAVRIYFIKVTKFRWILLSKRFFSLTHM